MCHANKNCWVAIEEIYVHKYVFSLQYLYGGPMTTAASALSSAWRADRRFRGVSAAPGGSGALVQIVEVEERNLWRIKKKHTILKEKILSF